MRPICYWFTAPAVIAKTYYVQATWQKQEDPAIAQMGTAVDACLTNGSSTAQLLI